MLNLALLLGKAACPSGAEGRVVEKECQRSEPSPLAAPLAREKDASSDSSKALTGVQSRPFCYL